MNSGLATLALAGMIMLCGKANGQNCKVTCPANIVVKADSTKEGARVEFSGATSSGDCGSLTYTPASGSFFRIGSHSVIVTSGSGQKCSFTVTVTDNEPPILSAITLSTKKLWPPSNKMKKVAVYYTASDNAEQVSTTVTVSSNADISKGRDWEVINNHLVRLRAARLPNGEPRIFTITVSTSDLAGNVTRRSTSITVSNNITVESLVSTELPEDAETEKTLR